VILRAWIGRTIWRSSETAGDDSAGSMSEAVEQGDAADEGRLVAGEAIMVGRSAGPLSLWVRARSCALRS
jgi:hypothetical protein